MRERVCVCVCAGGALAAEAVDGHRDEEQAWRRDQGGEGDGGGARGGGGDGEGRGRGAGSYECVVFAALVLDYLRYDAYKGKPFTFKI